MASAAIFSSLRRRRSPSLDAFLAPVEVSDGSILGILRAISAELLVSFDKKAIFFQVKNSRNLIRKIQVFSVLLDAFHEVGFSATASTVFMCLKELYLLLYRCKILIDYVKGSSKLWLLLQHHFISGNFHDLNQEISTLLDVFPLGEINLSEDVKEHFEFLCKQSRKSRFFIDKHDDLLRLKLYHFLNEFESGRVPERAALHSFFVEKLRICDVESCRNEIEFLEEQLVNHDGDIEPTASVLNGFVALMRYCRFLLFRFEDEGKLGDNREDRKKGTITHEIADMCIVIPKDFCCPVSLDLMRDPVIVSTGQTYERSSIARWMQEGHLTCPKTGQMLVHTKLVPNRALRNLIVQWCVANDIPCDPPENSEYPSECALAASMSKAAVEATRVTAHLLVEELANGTPRAKAVAAMEIRLLAKTGRENRACIAELGAIPLLKRLLSSEDVLAQENSITAMLNLSIFDRNKCLIMEVEGCLEAIVEVLRYGHTVEARENAAATLFSLSAVHSYKKAIADHEWAVEALATLLREGTPRGKKDAVTALFNLSTHNENCSRMIDSGAVTALVEVLESEVVSEEAAGALALIVRQPLGATAVASEERAVAGLIGMMSWGTPRGKENVVAALLELCRSGGPAVTERVLKAPALAGLLQTLLFTGTKRARRKAASLARVFQRSENTRLHLGGLGVGYALAGNSAVASDATSFAGDVSVPMSISVPVL